MIRQQRSTLDTAVVPRSVTPGWRPLPVAAVLSGGAVAVSVWPVVVSVRTSEPVHVTGLLAHVTGMLSGYGFVVLVGLMSRHPAIERGLGADRLARWHSSLGRVVVALVLVHAWAATAAWAHAVRSDLWRAWWQVLAVPGLVAATVATVVLLAVAVSCSGAVRRRMDHETWHTLHLLVYMAVALSLSHQLAGPDVAGHRGLQVVWALLYTGAFGLVLEHRLITPARNALRHRLRVASVTPEGPGVVSVVVEGRDLQLLGAEAGQFFRWRFLAPQLWRTAHPFSLSAAPTRTHLRLTVKALGDGTTRLQRVRPGTRVVAEGPYGALTAQRRTRPDVVLIASGVGITPMRALFETMPLEEGQDLVLLGFARTEAEVLFRAELDHLSVTRGGRVHHVVGVQEGVTAGLLQALVPGIEHRDVFVCGPPRMAAALRDALRDAGLPSRRLHEERFPGMEPGGRQPGATVLRTIRACASRLSTSARRLRWTSTRRPLS